MSLVGINPAAPSSGFIPNLFRLTWAHTRDVTDVTGSQVEGYMRGKFTQMKFDGNSRISKGSVEQMGNIA